MFTAIGSQGRSSVSILVILKHTFLEVRADAEVLNDDSKRGAEGIDSGGCVHAWWIEELISHTSLMAQHRNEK